jgi:hypothetical protein
MIEKAFGCDSLREAQKKLLYRRFKDAWESVESDPRSGRPSTRTIENVERVRAAINENGRLTVRELEVALGIPRAITKEDYTEVLRRLRDAVRRKRPQLWASGDWQLHYDNVHAYSTALVQDLLVNHRITQVCQFIYSQIWLPVTSCFSQS